MLNISAGNLNAGSTRGPRYLRGLPLGLAAPALPFGVMILVYFRRDENFNVSDGTFEGDDCRLGVEILS